jgi:uncharacterized membrane protein required for colicin V production
MNYTYSQYVGIVDIVLIIGLIILMIVGFKKGFLLKSISLANWLFGFIFALLFCVRFANDVLYNWFGTDIEQNFYNNIMANDKFNDITSESSGVSVLEGLGIPGFVARMVSSNVSGEDIASQIAANLAAWTTNIILIVVSFLILFFGTTVICFILKLFAKLLRQSKFVRVLDGILGIFLYIVLYYIFLQIIFFVLILIYHKAGLAGYNEFIDYDIRGITAGFRLTRWLFENNILGNFIGLLF